MAFVSPDSKMDWLESFETVENDYYRVEWNFNNTDNYWYIDIYNMNEEKVEVTNFKVVVGRNIILSTNKYFLAIRSLDLRIVYTKESFACMIIPATFEEEEVEYPFVIAI